MMMIHSSGPVTLAITLYVFDVFVVATVVLVVIKMEGKICRLRAQRHYAQGEMGETCFELSQLFDFIVEREKVKHT